MKAVVLAYHNIGCAGIEALLRNGFDIAAVFTHQDDPQENQWFDSVAEFCAVRNIPVFAPENINHPLWQAKIQALAPDILFSFYYRNLVKQEILSIPPQGCLNLHGSLLPKYRGRAPINWVLVQGETETGVTLHYMTPRPDDGDIVGQAKVAISEDDTAKTLNNKLTHAANELLDEYLPKLLAGTAPRIPQNHSLASYFGGRRPADGEINWEGSASSVRNLVRAVTRPYPGAFTTMNGQKCFIWQATRLPVAHTHAACTVISTNPLIIACGQEQVKIDFAQSEKGLYSTGSQLARQLNLVEGVQVGGKKISLEAPRKKKVLILGVDGFIGNFLSERLLQSGNYEVYGLDLRCHHTQRLLSHPDFHFFEGDISIHRDWIDYHIKKCDVVLPLVAIATPIEYTRNPLRVFELDFEENLRIVRQCVKYKKRIIFPSTSEVYGMCTDEAFDEDNSPLVLGPVRMKRWIYSCSKQLLDRVIWGYGEQGLRFTIFRPFNWIGPRLDSLAAARTGNARAITQLILNLIDGTPILLVDGGAQQRCFTDIDEGVDCLFRIIEADDGSCDGKIFNIGNPDNEFSIKEFAQVVVEQFHAHPLHTHFPPFAGFHETESGNYYGTGYQDVQRRRPSIRNAQRSLHWQPVTALAETVAKTMDFFLREVIEQEKKSHE